MPSSLLSFCLGATYDTLPSPSNLHRWNIITETSSKLCHKQICSTAHVFGACKFVLQRAGLLFDTVLFWMPLFLYSIFFFFIISYTVLKTNHNASIKYVKAGSKPQKSIKKRKLVCYNLHQIGNYTLISTISFSFFCLLQWISSDIMLFFILFIQRVWSF